MDVKLICQIVGVAVTCLKSHWAKFLKKPWGSVAPPLIHCEGEIESTAAWDGGAMGGEEGEAEDRPQST
jgi:hypothetical protein